MSEMNLKRLSAKTRDQIVSSQVIVDLSQMLKELIENSLDSQSSIVKVVMGSHGADFLEVSDNGVGIDEKSLLKMWNFGGTSKIDEYEDIHSISSFGFRGEGLAAIKQFSDIEVFSRVHDVEKGFKAFYTSDKAEPILESVQTPVGTRVRILQPFSLAKSKREELLKTARLDFKNLVEYVQTYALILPQIKFEFYHSIDSKMDWVFNYQENSTILTRIREVWGASVSKVVEECSHVENDIKIKSFCSNLIISGSIQTNFVKQSVFRLSVNGKPAAPLKYIKMVLDKVYSEYNKNAKYFVLLQLEVPRAWVDFNSSKDKREMILKNKEDIKKAVYNMITHFLNDTKGNQKEIANNDEENKQNRLSKIIVRKSQALGGDQNQMEINEKRWSQKSNSQSESKISGQISSFFQRYSQRDSQKDGVGVISQNSDVIKEFQNLDSSSHIQNSEIDNNNGDNKSLEVLIKKSTQSEENEGGKEDIARNQHDEIKEDFHSSKISKKMDLETIQKLKDKILLFENGENKQIDSKIEVTNQENSVVYINLQEVSQNIAGDCLKRSLPAGESELNEIDTWNSAAIKKKRVNLNRENMTSKFEDSIVDTTITEESRASEFIEKMRERLWNSRIDEKCKIDKFTQKNFKDLKVIGQFNKGFIIWKWQDGDERYFVIDQHAADEKYNFEQMKNTLKFSTQVLLSPIIVHLTITEFISAEQYETVFRSNGFRIDLIQKPEENVYQARIIGVPNVHNRKYDDKDFRDLLYLVMNHGSYLEDIIIPSAKRDLASRSWRMSTMIGDPLNLESMKKIIANLGDLQHPWNCPHGRPTTIIANKIKEKALDRARIVKKLVVEL